MPARRRSRVRALQVLYLLDVRKESPEDGIAAFRESLDSSDDEVDLQLTAQADPFMEELVKGVWTRAAQIDGRIGKHSEHWRLERMSTVDRNILRLAVYEMTEVGTPPAVAIDEAIELARRFSGDESVPFINGILDAVRKENQSSAAPADE